MSNNWKAPLMQALVAFVLMIGISVGLTLASANAPAQAAHEHEDYADMENEVEGDAEAIEYGRQRFARRCAYCHGGGGMGAKGPSLTKGKFKWSRKALTTDLVNIIMGGIPNTQMGAFGRTLDGDEVLKIIAYIRLETERVRVEAIRAAADQAAAEQAEAK